jgi:hypothetical protein
MEATEDGEPDYKRPEAVSLEDVEEDDPILESEDEDEDDEEDGEED